MDHNGNKLIPFYKRKDLLSILNQQMNSELRDWKQKIHYTDTNTNTNTHTQTYSNSASHYTVLVMDICRDWWTTSSNDLLIVSMPDHMPPFAITSAPQLPGDSQDTRHTSHEMLQDSVSYWCCWSCPVILDQHYTSLGALYSLFRKDVQKIPYQTVGRSAGETDFHVIYIGRKAKFRGRV